MEYGSSKYLSQLKAISEMKITETQKNSGSNVYQYMLSL